MDKNENNVKIHAQDKDCIYQRSSDVSIFFREYAFNIMENITVNALTYIIIIIIMDYFQKIHTIHYKIIILRRLIM